MDAIEKLNKIEKTEGFYYNMIFERDYSGGYRDLEKEKKFIVMSFPSLLWVGENISVENYCGNRIVPYGVGKISLALKDKKVGEEYIVGAIEEFKNNFLRVNNIKDFYEINADQMVSAQNMIRRGLARRYGLDGVLF